MADSEQTSSGSEETLTAAPEDQIVGVDAEAGLSGDAPLSAISADTADSFGAYARASFQRIRSGESGAGPIIIGLIAIIIFFQIEQPIFLHASNLGNLFPAGLDLRHVRPGGDVRAGPVGDRPVGRVRRRGRRVHLRRAQRGRRSTGRGGWRSWPRCS